MILQLLMFLQNQLFLGRGDLAGGDGLIQKGLVFGFPGGDLVLMILVKDGLDIGSFEAEFSGQHLHQRGSLFGGNLGMNTSNADKGSQAEGENDK